MRAKLTDWFWKWCGVAAAGGALAGCDANFLAVEAQPGDLRGQWLVNESTTALLNPDCPLVAHVTIRNKLPRKVRMVSQIRPAIGGKPDVKWKAYRKLPATLEAGASWEGVWQLTDSLEAGRYSVTTGETEAFVAEQAQVEIRDEKLPVPVRTQHHCVAARLTGEVDQVVEMLTREIETGKAPPSTYLQLAQLMESLGNPDAARHQYGLFAERVYGNEAPPGWLQSKLSKPEHE